LGHIGFALNQITNINDVVLVQNNNWGLIEWCSFAPWFAFTNLDSVGLELPAIIASLPFRKH